jgi:glycosyltransferase involved in cell wall biosynthesis
MESYLRNLYSRMPQSEFDFVAFGSREFARADTSWFPGEVIDSGVSSVGRVAWTVGELTAVSRAAHRHHAALIHSPANVGPRVSRTPVVLTVHDLLPFRFPEFVPGPYAPVLRALVRGAARHARRVITISERSRADIMDLLHIPAERIDTIPLAGSRAVVSPGVEREPGLLLALGNRLPHKNFEGLIEALALVDARTRPRLVIPGGNDADPLRSLVNNLGLQDWVELRGWIDNDDLESLYARATAVVVPSYFEGFGLPVLEAMARGCPVICSDLPVLHEVASDAAVYFDPARPASIAKAVSSTLGDPHLLHRLGSAGSLRADLFSWERTAAATLHSFGRALE